MVEFKRDSGATVITDAEGRELKKGDRVKIFAPDSIMHGLCGIVAETYSKKMGGSFGVYPVVVRAENGQLGQLINSFKESELWIQENAPARTEPTQTAPSTGQ
jgi:hypothetical protein